MEKAIQQGFSESWKLYSRYYETDPEDAAAFDNMLIDAGSIAAKYKKFPVIEEFLIVLLKDIDRRSGERVLQ